MSQEIALSRLRAADVAVRAIVVVNPRDSLLTAAYLMYIHRVDTLPVVTQKRRLIGLIGIGDILRAPKPGGLIGDSGRDRTMEETMAALRTTEIGSVMARHLVTATEDTPASELLADIVNRGAYPIPVVDGDRLVGLVGRGDLVAALLRASAGRTLRETHP